MFVLFSGSFFSCTFGSMPIAIAYLVPFDYSLMMTSGLFIKLRYFFLSTFNSIFFKAVSVLVGSVGTYLIFITIIKICNII